MAVNYDLCLSMSNVGRAILTPNWMRYVLQKEPETVRPRLAHFAKAVWGLDGEDDTILAEQAINATHDF